MKNPSQNTQIEQAVKAETRAWTNYKAALKLPVGTPQREQAYKIWIKATWQLEAVR